MFSRRSDPVYKLFSSGAFNTIAGLSLFFLAVISIISGLSSKTNEVPVEISGEPLGTLRVLVYVGTMTFVFSSIQLYYALNFFVYNIVISTTLRFIGAGFISGLQIPIILILLGNYDLYLWITTGFLFFFSSGYVYINERISKDNQARLFKIPVIYFSYLAVVITISIVIAQYFVNDYIAKGFEIATVVVLLFQYLLYGFIHHYFNVRFVDKTYIQLSESEIITMNSAYNLSSVTLTVTAVVILLVGYS